MNRARTAVRRGEAATKQNEGRGQAERGRVTLAQ